MLPITLEIDGWIQSAIAPQEICRGEGFGPVVYLPNRGGDFDLDKYLTLASEHNERHLYICDYASTALRPLIPHARGFVFGAGSTLGHFAGVLRYHHIPACIDASLWQWARDKVLTRGVGQSGCLRCGSEVVLSVAFRTQYAAQVADYRRRLRQQRLAITVYDVVHKQLCLADRGADVPIGEKALAVNALQVAGLSTAKALILTHPDEAGTHLDQDPAFRSLLARVFPLFERAPGYALIVRASLHSDDGSHLAWSGSIPSPSVTSLAGLLQVVASQVARWQTIRARGIGLAIILQERITAPLRGILGTGRPWEYSMAGVVAELTSVTDGAAQNSVFLEEVEAGLRNGSIDETVRRLIGPKTALESVRLGDTLAGLVHDSLALRDYYAIPLDIEFVVTGEGGYGFVQFRPLFRL